MKTIERERKGEGKGEGKGERRKEKGEGKEKGKTQTKQQPTKKSQQQQKELNQNKQEKNPNSNLDNSPSFRSPEGNFRNLLLLPCADKERASLGVRWEAPATTQGRPGEFVMGSRKKKKGGNRSQVP